MIARKNKKTHLTISQATYMTIKTLARKGTKEDFERFLEDVCRRYIADVRDTDYIDEDDYLKIKDREFECTCPNCNYTMKIDFGGER